MVLCLLVPATFTGGFLYVGLLAGASSRANRDLDLQRYTHDS